MGIFDWLFGNRPKEDPKKETVFKMLDGYTPTFRTHQGGLYEQELVRAAIEARARHMGKLQVQTFGAAKPALQNKLKHGPNELQTWDQFLRKLSTCLDVNGTAFITPVFDEEGAVSGIYCPVPSKCTVVQYKGQPFLKYTFGWGETAAVELTSCGIMTAHQYRNDFFGESNAALAPTMDLLDILKQGIQEGVQNAAAYRFVAQLDNWTSPDDLAEERARFNAKNFGRDAKAGGLLLLPNTYKNLKQLEAKPWLVDADQMKLINENVYNYFGVNEDILQNKAFGDAWAAFYEGAVEPFAIQLSSCLTRMLFTFREQTAGNYAMATANRLQYLSNADKLAVSAQMADRGLMTRNEIREIWNLPPLPEPLGDQLPVRGEYYNVGEEDNQEGGADQ